MAKALDVAQYIYDYYKEIYKEKIDEMKLHKLLYFCQREKLAITNESLFNESMEGWIHGPVVPEVRAYFARAVGLMCTTNDLSEDDAYIIRNVICQYGNKASLELRALSHREYSWKHSREGLHDDDRGKRDLLIEDIKVDAEKVRPFDCTWGMYYDEFEDLEEVQ